MIDADVNNVEFLLEDFAEKNADPTVKKSKY